MKVIRPNYGITVEATSPLTEFVSAVTATSLWFASVMGIREKVGL